MRRALLTFALTALAVPASASAAPPQAFVKLAKCSLETHEAEFYARMRAVEGSERMALRITLLERTGAEGWRRVNAPGLRSWRSSKPGVGVFGYRQAVKNLPGNAAHRASVDFRWYSADGDVVQRARRRSRSCRQFAELPNLVAQIARLGRVDKGVRRYVVQVSNTGKAAVAAAPVQLSVDGVAVDSQSVPLAPGETRTLVFSGPACKRTVRVEADPAKLIAETSEDDNSHELSCS
jgi:hypothetical protein